MAWTIVFISHGSSKVCIVSVYLTEPWENSLKDKRLTLPQFPGIQRVVTWPYGLRQDAMVWGLCGKGSSSPHGQQGAERMEVCENQVRPLK